MQVIMKSMVAAAILSGAGVVSAQTFLDALTETCKQSVNDLLNSPDAACMNPSALLQFFVGNQQSVPTTVDSWLTGLCASGSCPDETIATVVTNVTTACSQDLASVGAPADIAQQIIPIAQQAYPTARKVACLKDDTANQLCATQTVTNLESTVGQLGLDDLTFMNLMDDAQQLLDSGLQNLACTSCLKEAYTIARQDFPDVVSLISDQAVSVCGAEFIDGSLPEGISQTDADGVFVSQSQAGSGALASASLGRATTALAVGFFAFAFLG